MEFFGFMVAIDLLFFSDLVSANAQAKHFGATLWPWLDCTQIARGEKRNGADCKQLCHLKV